MTAKQEETIKKKITQIKRGLAQDKKHWGGYYHDGRGLRYLPPELYLKIKDFSGAFRYFNWFTKNFPEDIGSPIFLFEWTITLFKTERIEKAEKKAMETFSSNTYLFDRFLKMELISIDKLESSNWESANFIEHLKYSKDQEEFTDFAEWLETFTQSAGFSEFAKKFLEIQTTLKTEPVGQKRTELINRRRILVENL